MYLQLAEPNPLRGDEADANPDTRRHGGLQEFASRFVVTIVDDSHSDERVRADRATVP